MRGESVAPIVCLCVSVCVCVCVAGVLVGGSLFVCVTNVIKERLDIVLGWG